MFQSVSVFLCLAVCGLAVDTRYWSQDAQSDFEKGNLKKIALRSDGRLSLSPAVKELADLSIPYLWAVTTTANGTVYTAGGPSSDQSAIYEVTRAGQSKKFAEIEGMNIFALAVDRGGRLFAATSPDGRIYRISAVGKAELFYDPKSKYIWSLAFLPNGDLLAATGDRGELHRITPAGVGKVWMKLDEDHIRSLAVDAKGTVYVGTEPGGLIVRVDDQGNGFVVYQSAKREVTSLATSPNGNLYASIIGMKTTGASLLTPTLPVTAAPAPAPNAQSQGAARPAAPATPPLPASVPGGSEVIQIDPGGAPLKVWSHSSDIVYSLAVDNNQKLIIGTGNKGNLYRVDSPSESTLLSSFSPTQITGFAKDGKRLLAVTGNVGKLLEIASTLDSEGSYESDIFDAGSFSQWGRMHTKEITNGGSIRYETRSGNLDRPTQLWSPWVALKEGRIVSPAARFLQWRATFAGTDPSLSQVDIAYLPKNIAPRIDAVEATPANYRFPAPSVPIVPATVTLTLPAIGRNSTSTSSAPPDGSTSPALTYARGMIGARWVAIDENNDTLEFNLEIKGEKEQNWKPLKDKLRDRYYSFDSTAFADGLYRVRVTATDAPSNPINEALTATSISAPFLIDNTAPVIRELAATASGNRVTLRFKASDASSVLAKAEVSLNGGAWTPIEPTVRLIDSKDLEFQVPLERPAPGELTIAVRVTDEFDNQSVEKVSVR